MKETLYVVFGPSGHEAIRKTEPKRSAIPHRGGYFKFTYEVDDAYFTRPPAPEVEVDIPVEKIGQPEVEVQVVDPEDIDDEA